ncbi:TetR/AcrR family transcriptional regulator [Plantactinospora solaniradicis]|uniref:TetR/AcrR family transcriptional regulator n=1 Tax=Plantactinospora solaniradicis TaxID=1723736 RepID=A0ABW1K237_9ACTN
MPRVSDEHLAARRQQILDAARRCFLRNGFHATSMQDVIGEAGLSVGAVYRYFRSKHELVTSIAESVLDGADDLFAAIDAAEPPPPLVDAVEQALGFVETQIGQDGVFPLAVQVWAESLRDPELADFVARMYGGFRSRLVTLARRAQQAGELPPDADPEAVGAVLLGLVQGFALQRLLAAGPDRKTYLSGLRAMLDARSRTAG